MLPESSSRPLTATLAQSRNLAHASLETAVQRFRVKCGLLGSEAGKGRQLDLGRISANDAKRVYEELNLVSPWLQLEQKSRYGGVEAPMAVHQMLLDNVSGIDLWIVWV